MSTYTVITAQLINSKEPVLPKIGLTDLEYCCALGSFPRWPFGNGFCLYISCEYSKQGDSLTLGSKVEISYPVQNSSTENKHKYSDSEYARPKKGVKERRTSMIYPFDRQLTYDHCAEMPVAT